MTPSRALVGLVLSLIPAILPTAAAEPIDFDALIGRPHPSQKACADAARRVAERLTGAPATTFPDDAEVPRVVIVSGSDGTHSARTFAGHGDGLAAAADAAMARAGDQAAWEWVRVDVLLGVEPVEEASAAQWSAGIDGLVLAGEAFVPDELLARQVIDTKGRLRNGDLSALALERALPPASRPTHRFTTAAFFLDEEGPVPLYRGHRAFDQPSRNDLEAAALAGQAYLLEGIDARGRVVYQYDAARDRVADDFNLVRHAGTAWSMLDLYAHTRDADLLAAAERAIAYFLAQMKPMKAPGGEVSVLVEANEVKLGCNALAVLALAEHAAVTGRREMLESMRALAEGVLSAQDGSGRFVAHKQSFPGGERFDYESEYYPGEAILALLRAHDLTDEPRFLDAAVRGANYLIEIRDAAVPDDKLPHDHWFLYALDRLYAKRPEPAYLNHAFRLARAIVAAQYSREAVPFPDLAGSWTDFRGTPAATRSEGLLAAVRLARRAGRFDDAAAFLTAAQNAIAFQLRTQFRPELAMYLPDPPQALGAFRGHLLDASVRIDFVQHNVSAIIALLRATDE